MSSRKKIVIIAGPNGAGKTTFAQEFLPKEAGCPVFVNADLISAGLSPFSPAGAALRAARVMLEEIKSHVRRGDDFAFETTLSGLTYARMIPKWRRAGYNIELIYLSMANPEMAIARVAARVRQGGHAVPDDVIRRRFASGRRNFDEIYKALVDVWILYDNSEVRPRLIEKGESR
jgi:predicted ABC-type ATPase